MVGRYPDFDVLEQVDHWDPATRRVVLARLDPPGDFRFFNPTEVRALTRFCDDVLAQDCEPRIPVLHAVDAWLAAGRTEGFHYAGMPRDDEVWRRVAACLDEEARERGADDFAECSEELRATIVDELLDGSLATPSLKGIDAARAGAVLIRDTVGAFYEHPWAWNEIGFPGPAYPRGYTRLGLDLSETWEAEECRP